jgi:hypothetical protein
MFTARLAEQKVPAYFCRRAASAEVSRYLKKKPGSYTGLVLLILDVLTVFMLL